MINLLLLIIGAILIGYGVDHDSCTCIVPGFVLIAYVLMTKLCK